MPLSSLLSAAGQKPKPSAQTLNAHLAQTSSPISVPSSPYTQYHHPTLQSSPFHASRTSYNSSQKSHTSRSQTPSTSPSPSSSPPREFLPPSSPPVPGEGVARLAPHSPALNELDKVYERSEHARPEPVEGWRMIGAGGVGNPWSEEKRADREDDGMGENGQGREKKGPASSGLAPSLDLDEGVEVRARKALKVLEDHLRDRMPFVQLSSKRMQAVMGVRNNFPFDLPDTKRSSASICMPTSPSGLDAGLSLRTASRNPSTFKFMNPLSPHNSPYVDPNTGKGLREWLLSKGKEYGMRKRECRSISFHDFTPDMRSNGWSNKLLGHYAANSAGERVDFYEIDLPTPNSTTQPWIWFLISRPLLSINPKNTSTRPPHQNKISHPSSTPQTFYTPSSLSSSPLDTSTHTSSLPPNFPAPVQTSWMVFACPLSNVVAYPEALDAQPPSQCTILSRASRPSSQNQNQNGGKKLYKRRDFDFSRNGIPIFEFHAPSFPSPPSTSSSTQTSHQLAHQQFLSIGEIGPFYPGDLCSPLPEAEYIQNIKSFQDKAKAKAEAIAAGRDGEEERKVVSPWSGQWWKVFYEGVSGEVGRWEGVKASMGRGKCRVVVRFTEWEGEDEGERMDLDREEGVGLGLSGVEGVGMGLGGMGMGESRKIKERLVGRGRMTRSETRRRSGLGMGEVSSSGVVMGIGAAGGVKGKSKGGKK
ncbi:hypothetical protein L207DRAFT_638481 [Hyaloscypha variabilis F]|uniref:Uncharacterized protein n=1 Tax=Hyaloscypha variabilis (strain UAMH 11265 / GT02V1 / F) TaxID=1149755 RepID=A0A2J6R932_HYAVF|nr:hypothetical protein L207DRAFT_638481 [Hyaloscypha variabilis F]